MTEFIIESLKILTSAILGGLVVHFLEAYSRKRRESKIEDKSFNKLLNADNISKLMPGNSVDKMRTMLGEPLKIKINNNEEWSLFDDNKNIVTNSYIYKLKNVILKINSKDNVEIDTLSFKIDYMNLNSPKYQIDISKIFLDSYKIIIGKSKVTKEIIDLTQNHVPIQTMKEITCGFQFNLANPIYKSFTLFMFSEEKLFKYYESNNINDLLGADIIGLCISKMNGDSHFVFDYELV